VIFSQSGHIPLPIDEIREAAELREARYQSNRKYIDDLINWTFELKKATDDKEFIATIDKIYKKLRAFDNGVISDKKNDIRKIEYEIKEEIEKYNKRIAVETNPETFWNEGNKLLEAYDYKRAIEQFGYVIQLNADFAGSYFNRGYCYYQLGNAEAAIEDFSSFIKLVQDEPDAYKYRGWARFDVKDFIGAMADFNSQIELQPESALAYYSRGSVKAELNDNYGAISDYEKAIELNENFSMAYNNLAWSKFKLKKYKEALVDVDKAISLDQENIAALDTRAEVKFKLNDYTGCIEDCDASLLLNPKLSNSYFLKGRSSYKLGKKQDACLNWSKAGELGKAEAYDYISKYCNN